MIKKESYNLSIDDIDRAIRDYLIKHNIIKTPELVADITINGSGRDVFLLVTLINEGIKIE